MTKTADNDLFLIIRSSSNRNNHEGNTNPEKIRAGFRRLPRQHHP
jgi:hypothetical protein